MVFVFWLVMVLVFMFVFMFVVVRGGGSGSEHRANWRREGGREGCRPSDGKEGPIPSQRPTQSMILLGWRLKRGTIYADQKIVRTHTMPQIAPTICIR